MSIVLVGSTSGSVTLQEPAVAGTTVLDLPAVSGTVATLTTPSFVTTIGVGGATAAASGAGITFPASQSASTDANTLDDYEEGTWTATVSAGSIASQNCTYTKIGRAVFLCGEITYGVGTTTEDPSFSGLPFTSANTNEPAVAIYSQNMEVSSGGPIIGVVLKNNTQIAFYSFVNNGLGSARQSAGYISFHAVYFV